jgi:hypothetical protein
MSVHHRHQEGDKRACTDQPGSHQPRSSDPSAVRHHSSKGGGWADGPDATRTQLPPPGTFANTAHHGVLFLDELGYGPRLGVRHRSPLQPSSFGSFQQLRRASLRADAALEVVVLIWHRADLRLKAQSASRSIPTSTARSAGSPSQSINSSPNVRVSGSPQNSPIRSAGSRSGRRRTKDGGWVRRGRGSVTSDR